MSDIDLIPAEFVDARVRRRALRWSGIASGSVIRNKRRIGEQPRFSAACSIAGSRLASEAATFM